MAEDVQITKFTRNLHGSAALRSGPDRGVCGSVGALSGSDKELLSLIMLISCRVHKDNFKL